MGVVLAFLAKLLKGFLAFAVGEVQAIAAGGLAALPFSGLALRALGYAIPLAVAFVAQSGLFAGLVNATIAVFVVLGVNAIRVLFHIPLSLN